MHSRPRRAALAVLLAAGLALGALPAPSGAGPLADPPTRIFIQSDQDFTPAHWVRGGTGTTFDPFVIADLTLDDPNATLALRYTSAHVVLRNVTIRSSGFQSSLVVELSSNVTIEDLHVEADAYERPLPEPAPSVRVQRSDHVAILRSRINGTGDGIGLYYSRDVSLNSNNLTGGGFSTTLDDAPGGMFWPTSLTDNTVNGGPLVFHTACGGTQLRDLVVGQLFVAGCNDFTLANVSGTQRLPLVTLSNVANASLENSTLGDLRMTGDGITLDDVRIDGRAPLPLYGTNITLRRVHLVGGGLVAQSVVGLRLHDVTASVERGYAMSIGNSWGVEILRADITVDNGTGVGVFGADQVRIVGSTIRAPAGAGVTFQSCGECSLQGTNITAYTYAAFVEASAGMEVAGNTLESATYASLYVRESAGLTLTDNYLGQRGLLLTGQGPDGLVHSGIGSSNFLAGGPLGYYADCEGLDLNGASLGQVIVANCTDVRVRNLAIRGAEQPVTVYYSVNVSLENVELAGHEQAMAAFAVDGLTLRGSRVSADLGCVFVSSAFLVSIEDNRFDGCLAGIGLNAVWESAVTGNTISATAFTGIGLSNSPHVRVAGNTMARGGIYIQGQYREAFSTLDIAPDNTAAGRPILFVKNQTGASFERGEYGQLLIANCSNATVAGVRVEGGPPGALIAYSDGATVVDSVFAGSPSDGLVVTDSQGVSLVNLTVAANGAQFLTYSPTANGIKLADSTVTIAGGVVSGTHGVGVRVDDGVNTTLRGTTIEGSADAGVEVRSGRGEVHLERVTLRSNDWGVRAISFGKAVVALSNSTVEGSTSGGASISIGGLFSAYDSMFVGNAGPGLSIGRGSFAAVGNTFRNNSVGVLLGGSTGGGVLAYNRIEDNGVGVDGRQANGATIHHNAFLNNTVQALGGISLRHWDAGFPEGGNYWSDYGGTDRCTSPTQDICPIPDGFGDTPYVIQTGSFGEPVADRYPLVGFPTRPVEEPDAVQDDSVPGVLDFLTALPGAMLLLLAPPAGAAAYMWTRVRRSGPPGPP